MIKHNLNGVARRRDHMCAVADDELMVNTKGVRPVQDPFNGKILHQVQWALVIDMHFFDGCDDIIFVIIEVPDAVFFSKSDSGIFKIARITAVPYNP